LEQQAVCESLALVGLVPRSRHIVSNLLERSRLTTTGLIANQDSLRRGSRSGRLRVLQGSACSRGIARSSGLRRGPTETESAPTPLHWRGIGWRRFSLENGARDVQAPGVWHSFGSRTSQRSQISLCPEGFHVIAGGVVFGIALAAISSQVLKSFLYEVKPSDPLTLIAVGLLFVGVGLLACWIPASRAQRVNPLEALRYD